MSFQNYINPYLPESFSRDDSPSYPLSPDIFWLALLPGENGSKMTGRLYQKSFLTAKVARTFRKDRKVPIAIGMNLNDMALRTLRILRVLCG
jgi:hypothetical protein